MGRPKKYVREDVIEKAMRLFWQAGYKATSVGDLVEATGLNTASMYKEFEDKDGLFLEALKYYRGNIVSQRLQILVDQPNLAGVTLFFQNVLEGAAKPDYKGCLMMNHLAQKHVISPKASRQIGRFVAEVEALLKTALTNALRDGEIPKDKDPTALASFLVASIHGVVLYGRLNANKPKIPALSGPIFKAILS